MKQDALGNVRLFTFLLGCVLFVGGVAMLSVPAGIIAAGVLAMGFSVGGEIASSYRRPAPAAPSADAEE